MIRHKKGTRTGQHQLQKPQTHMAMGRQAGAGADKAVYQTRVSSASVEDSQVGDAMQAKQGGIDSGKVIPGNHPPQHPREGL